MNWKILLVSAIAVIAVIVLGSLQIIGVSLATILSLIIGVIGIILPILNDLRKPKTSLHIEQPELKKREYGGYQGYKIVTLVTNKGKKIVYNLEASVNFREQVEFLDITIYTRNKPVKVSNHPFNKKEYRWKDSEGKILKDRLIPELRNDPMTLMFPKCLERPLIAYVGGLNSSSDIKDRITLLKLEPNKTYKVKLELEGLDSEKTIVRKEKEFKIKTP